MNIKEGIEKRFSVRAFKDKAPSMYIIKKILKLQILLPLEVIYSPGRFMFLTTNQKIN